MVLSRAFGRVISGILAIGVVSALALTAQAATTSATASPPSTIAMSRISGADRYATSVALAQAEYPTAANIAFIATGSNYPDALAAGAVATSLGGPLLLTDPLTLPADVAAELTSLAPSTVVVIGGPGAVSPSVTDELAAAVPHARIDRVAGADRFATAVAIVNYGFTSAPSVYLATADNYPDALSAAGAAGDKGQPVVLVDGNENGLSAEVTQLLLQLGTKNVTIVGGPGAVSTGIESALDSRFGSGNVDRLAGADRYATSTVVATSTFTGATTAYIATGTNYPDALAGSVLAGHAKEPLVLVPSTCVPAGTLAAFSKLGVTSATLVGGAGAVSDSVSTLATCSGIPAHPDVRPATILAPASIDGRNWPYATFDRVHCDSSSSCVAVGTWLQGAVSHSLFGSYSNGVWSRVASASIPAGTGGPGESTTVPGLANCAADLFCASFEQATSSTSAATLTISGNGVTVVTDAPLPPNHLPINATISAIECTSSRYCVAVGEYVGSDGNPGYNQDPLIETFANGVWTASEAPAPSGEQWVNTSNLNDVSCVSDSVCAAVGGNNFWDPSINVTGYGAIGETIRP